VGNGDVEERSFVATLLWMTAKGGWATRIDLRRRCGDHAGRRACEMKNRNENREQGLRQFAHLRWPLQIQRRRGGEDCMVVWARRDWIGVSDIIADFTRIIIFARR
jgi:hypothetical protein